MPNTADYLNAREAMIRALREELVGPCPRGGQIDCAATLAFDTYQEANGPYRQSGSGDEVLIGDRPTKRYGIGVLYPMEVALGADPDGQDEDEAVLSAIGNDADADAARDDPAAALAARTRLGAPTDDDDLPLSTANAFRPSSFGLSFFCDLGGTDAVDVELVGARYREKDVQVRATNSGLTWWLREEVRVIARFERADLLAKRGLTSGNVIDGGLPEDMRVDLVAFSRPAGEGRTLLTLSAVNRSQHQSADSVALFQAQLSCRSTSGEPFVLPYEESQRVGEDPELESLALLYRDTPAFAVGHGCSADWEAEESAAIALSVRTTALPDVQVPSTTPNIKDGDGQPIEVPMAPLAGLVERDDGYASLQDIVGGYSNWIEAQEARISNLTEEHRPTAREHLDLCQTARDRMQEGIAFLQSGVDPAATAAFRLANEAMLLQQQRSGLDLRPTVYDRDQQRIVTSGTFSPRTEGRGRWRPFQIAFVLAALKSTVTDDDPERETVELIFFPTGGGKTEAYLALTAFSIFYRRLKDTHDVGVDVLMRYTLRLLTAQQFQRASALICAMEYLRSKQPEKLGEHEISIGVWLGGSVTPNSRTSALDSLRALQRNASGENPFVLLRCPWCQAQLGPIEGTGRRRERNTDPRTAGYAREQGTVILKCPDSSCQFHSKLPVYVIDDDVYEQRPSLVIGTVDKFAMLAFRPQARSLFGLGDDGRREYSPPNLIIQDELHLISGPLGSMVGLYETVIQELATDRRGDTMVLPKIIGSTATIRRYETQVRDLYCRNEVALFPPRGLDAGDSYFASYARDDHGKLLPGRVYVGIHGTGLGSVQTAQVRSFTAMLQAAFALEADVQDPYWTLLVFFNSLRELGTSVSLLQSDIPDYFRVIAKRLGLKSEEVRRVWKDTELTGRLRNDEVPRAIAELEIRRTSDGSSHAVDVCLASNIIEVGVDIDRLSLMSVVGQPKTTSQYIQATGRVGRTWWERPGLVATIYNASKPRDRSHFEKFRSYHERLYAQVEPTSVTPFAPPVLDRALHAVMVTYVRQLSQLDSNPDPVPDDLLEQARELFMARVERVDPEEAERLAAVFDRRVRQWHRWDYHDWEMPSDGQDYGLIRFAGSYADPRQRQITWAVPTSLRNVDAECRAETTQAYLIAAERDEEPTV